MFSRVFHMFSCVFHRFSHIFTCFHIFPCDFMLFSHIFSEFLHFVDLSEPDLCLVAIHSHFRTVDWASTLLMWYRTCLIIPQFFLKKDYNGITLILFYLFIFWPDIFFWMMEFICGPQVHSVDIVINVVAVLYNTLLILVQYIFYLLWPSINRYADCDTRSKFLWEFHIS